MCFFTSERPHPTRRADGSAPNPADADAALLHDITTHQTGDNPAPGVPLSSAGGSACAPLCDPCNGAGHGTMGDAAAAMPDVRMGQGDYTLDYAADNNGKVQLLPEAKAEVKSFSPDLPANILPGFAKINREIGVHCSIAYLLRKGFGDSAGLLDEALRSGELIADDRPNSVETAKRADAAEAANTKR